MNDTVILLVGAAALGLFAVGRLLRSHVIRLLAGALVAVALASVVRWGVRAGAMGGKAEEWSAVLLLLALGYLLMRVALLLVFDWLLIRRFEIKVPRLARDIVALVLYLLLAAAILRTVLGIEVGTLLGSAALVTVVLGFALQETLGTLLSGLALTWEQRFETGSWVEIDGVVGEVLELGWRSLLLRTQLGERVLLPNSHVARARVRLLGAGEAAVAVPVRIGVAYDSPPHAVKETLARVAADVPLVLAQPAPSMLVLEFAESSITYECRLWTHQPWRVSEIADGFYLRAHAALARAGMEIPFPQRVVRIRREAGRADPLASARTALARCALFTGLPEHAIEVLAGTSHWQDYAPGETVVRAGDASRALFVIARGETVVERGGAEIARVGEGEVFGEMAFLSGAPRAATVRAATALAVVEVDSRALGALLLERSDLAEELANRMAARQQDLVAREAIAEEDAAPRGLARFLRERLLRLMAG